MKIIPAFILAIICAVIIYNIKHFYHGRQIAPYVKPVEGMTWGKQQSFKIYAYLA